MNKDFRSIADKRLSRLESHETLESLLIFAAEKNARIKMYSTGFALAFMITLAVALMQIIEIKPPGVSKLLTHTRTIPALIPFEPPLEDPDSLIAELGNSFNSDEALTKDYCINLLLEYYNSDGVREKALEAIQPLTSGDDPLLKESAEFGYAVLSGNFNNQNVIRGNNGSVFFTLFKHFSEYGSYNKVWMIQDGVLYVYYAFDAPQLYISGLFPSPDSSKIAVKSCSTKSEWITVLDIQNGAVSQELVGPVISSEDQTTDIYENSARIDNIGWQGNGVLLFDVILDENTYSASYSCADRRLWYVDK